MAARSNALNAADHSSHRRRSSSSSSSSTTTTTTTQRQQHQPTEPHTHAHALAVDALRRRRVLVVLRIISRFLVSLLRLVCGCWRLARSALPRAILTLSLALSVSHCASSFSPLRNLPHSSALFAFASHAHTHTLSLSLLLSSFCFCFSCSLCPSHAFASFFLSLSFFLFSSFLSFPLFFLPFLLSLPSVPLFLFVFFLSLLSLLSSFLLSLRFRVHHGGRAADARRRLCPHGPRCLCVVRTGVA